MNPAAIAQTMQQALSHHQAGRLAEAEALYRAVLQAEPNHTDALHDLGLIAHAVGRNDVATELLSRAIALQPSVARYHRNLGLVWQVVGELDRSIACYRRALALDGASADAWNGLGGAIGAKGQTAEAIECFRRATTLNEGFTSAWNNLGMALNASGRFQEAAYCYRRALALAPDAPDVHLNLSRSLASLNCIDESIVSCRRAVALRPDDTDAINTLGTRLMDQGKPMAAMDCFRKALSLKPDHALDRALMSNNLANALKDQGRLDEAITCYRTALKLSADLPAAHSNLLLAMQYHPGYDTATLHQEHLAWAQRHAAPLAGLIPEHRNDADPHRRLRVGYVSPDLRHHSVASFLRPLLTEHDHEAVEIICYSDVRSPDTMTDVLRKCADRWRPIAGLADEEVAQRILDDQVDILVDLAGHTANNRLKLFARKPAPVQVSYLGYQNTTGLSTVDYRLTDEHLDPPGLTEAYSSERLIRLPRTFACYHPVEGCPDVSPGPAVNGTSVTFGSFNRLGKTSPQMLGLWGRIVGSDPKWRLMIMAPGLQEPELQEHFRRMFAAQGGDARQLDLRPPKEFMEYMASHADVDILLDTLPFNGHTTTCHGLWMGVPLVTLAGDRYASRMGLSVLTNLRLGDLVATTPQQYVQLAVQLAGDRPRLAELRRTMRERMRRSPLMDAGAFARDVEAAYRRMWEQWCHQRKSAP